MWEAQAGFAIAESQRHSTHFGRLGHFPLVVTVLVCIAIGFQKDKLGLDGLNYGWDKIVREDIIPWSIA